MSHLSYLNLLNLYQVWKLFHYCYKPFEMSQSEPAELDVQVGTANLLLSSPCTSEKGEVQTRPVIPPWDEPEFLLQDHSGKLIILGQQSCDNSVCGFHQIHSGFSFTAPRSSSNTAGITHQKHLLITSACFQYPHQNSLQWKSMIVSLSVKEKVFLSRIGSQLLQTTAIPPPPLLLGHQEDPTLSTALLLITFCPTAGDSLVGGFVVCFSFAFGSFRLVLVFFYKDSVPL